MCKLTYEGARQFATEKHAGQYDKSGHPYITHPLRVSEKLEDETARIVALLHDILEDTDTTVEELRALGADDVIIEALLLLTHERDELYTEYLEAITRHPLARMVKLADIADNTDPQRMAMLPEATRTRLQEKYRRAMEILMRVGN